MSGHLRSITTSLTLSSAQRSHCHSTCTCTLIDFADIHVWPVSLDLNVSWPVPARWWTVRIRRQGQTWTHQIRGPIVGPDGMSCVEALIQKMLHRSSQLIALVIHQSIGHGRAQPRWLWLSAPRAWLFWWYPHTTGGGVLAMIQIGMSGGSSPSGRWMRCTISLPSLDKVMLRSIMTMMMTVVTMARSPVWTDQGSTFELDWWHWFWQLGSSDREPVSLCLAIPSQPARLIGGPVRQKRHHDAMLSGQTGQWLPGSKQIMQSMTKGQWTSLPMHKCHGHWLLRFDIVKAPVQCSQQWWHIDWDFKAPLSESQPPRPVLREPSFVFQFL